ncbi:MAG: DMT family transporter [Betaproteobacteria bacterium]|nr:DMT family transporter [Betaproteobacteria bacterium]MBU6511173.1 DMT family transporter [Betaproteobacteria bacterium]MDE1955934.1 DMT family transporter [Betaproteobacteria bacterium]MDE2478746.1 DMT family transporter [Betaproteobacteria bacterium]
MDSRLPIDARASSLMTLLCLIWGLQQVALKAFGGDISPLLQIALRSGVAALLVAALMRLQREPFDWAPWRPGLACAALFASEYLLVGQALRYTTASHTVVFLYTAPVFAALGLHLRLPAERLSGLQWAGVAMAFGGVAMAFLGPGAGAGLGPAGLLGDAMALGGGACWGATTVTIRLSRLSSTPPTMTLLWQLLGAFVLLLPASWLLGETHIRPSTQAWLELGFQALVVSFASFLAWFWLLRHYLASRLGIFSFMTPVFGVALGALLLHEPLSARFVAGAVLMFAGILVVSLHRMLAGLGARVLRA